MIEIFQNMLIAVTAAAVFSGILLNFIKEGAMKEMMRITAGLTIVAAILIPLTQVRVSGVSFSKVKKEYTREAEEAVEKNQALSYNIMEGKISQHIREAAQKAGIPCQVRTYISYDKDNTITVDRVEISQVCKEDQKSLSEIIFQECGIEKKKQVFVS